MTQLLRRNKSYIALVCILLLLGCTSDEEISVELPEEDDNEQTTSTFQRVTGIYALGEGINKPMPRLRWFRDYPFVDGYSWRSVWADFETGPNTYDFSVLDEVLSTIQRADKKMTFIISASVAPEDLLANNDVEKVLYTTGNRVKEEIVAPWDPIGIERWNAFITALSTYEIFDEEVGAMVPLKDHSTLEQVNASIIGIGSIRSRGGGDFFDSEDFDRTKFIMAIKDNLEVITNNFPTKNIFTGVWNVQDKISSPSLTNEILNMLETEFDGVIKPKIGLFQENLACETPVIGFAAPLFDSQDHTSIMFQMLQGWKSPFSDPSKTDNCLSDTNGPDVGMQYAIDTYNARYFEVYPEDLDFEGFWPALQKMHDDLEKMD